MKKIIAAFAAILVLAGPQAAAKKNAKPQIPVLEPMPMVYGDSTRTGIPYSKDPTVIRIGKEYYMYYSVPAYSKKLMPKDAAKEELGWNTAIARSKDLVNWTRVGELVLRDSKGSRIYGAVAPCVKVFDGKIHMFYQKMWEPAGHKNNIWHATSKDGITFTNAYDEPVFIPEAKWCGTRCIDAEVYKAGKKMILMFATRDPKGKIQMLGMAEAAYKSDYGPGKWTLVSKDGPFLKPDYDWEGHCIEAPTVIKEGKFWYLFYAGAYNHEKQQIGLAVSSDGIHFDRINPGEPFFRSGENGSWNAWESGHPGVFRDKDGQVYLFFQGKAKQNSNYFLSVCRVKFD